jgi:tetratricopeptide (TPR) repeat protein
MASSRTCCLAAIVVLGLVSTFCAARKPAPSTATAASPTVQPPSTRDIETLIERGCFTCLDRALTLARERGVSDLAFEAATLMTLRAGELGMPADRWLAEARELAANDPDAALYLEMVTAVPADPLNGERDDLLLETQARNRAQKRLPDWRATLHSASSSLVFRRYLELSLDCLVDTSAERIQEIARVVAVLPDAPVLRYRAGICNGRFTSDNVATLTALQQADAEYVDADYPLGKYALADREAPNQEEALRRFQSAMAAFPSSVAIAMSIGNLYQSWEEWANALDSFDRVLTMKPSHPDALLGRTISLSHLQRHQDAIDTATRLIDGGRWFLGQAFYWRSWNHFNMGNNDAARSDADRTRTLMVNSAVFLLSGLIEWKVPRLPSAEAEFEQSITMDFGQCLAALYLGGVRSERSKVPEAIAALQQARQCFDLSIAVHRAAIDKINAGRGTPTSKVREVAREEREIADAERRRDQAVKAIDGLQRIQRTNTR